MTFQELSESIASMAVVAIHEVCHRLISSLDLNLNEPSLVAVALLALEHTFVFVPLLLNQLSVPVCSTVPQPSLLSLIPVILHFFRCQLSHVTNYKIFWRDLPLQKL